MTEKEKMMAGIVYSVLDEELIRLHRACVDACALCDRLLPSQLEARREHLARILGKTGEHFLIEPGFVCDYGFNIEIGEHFFANYNLVILDCAPVRFGRNCFIGPQCGFYTACHPLDAGERAAGLEWARPVLVGNDVWFGGHVTVLPGVTIGDGSVIGAGSVVTRDIPPGVVAAGNPCRVLRPVTEKDRILQGGLPPRH
ncbi:sugar O-acetyltransferase [uncultured Mailhella sp.]|uniref:sugar O-acetyltransferase n=1 Tax=uncultured Mailhella sp. TaxID=1981031 RepID=UPI0025EA4BBC|nr:sugar O-acetyltransferase [uncultured Mailhella sp.]